MADLLSKTNGVRMRGTEILWYDLGGERWENVFNAHIFGK